VSRMRARLSRLVRHSKNTLATVQPRQKVDQQTLFH